MRLRRWWRQLGRPGEMSRTAGRRTAVRTRNDASEAAVRRVDEHVRHSGIRRRTNAA